MGYCVRFKNNWKREVDLVVISIFNIMRVFSLFCQFQSLFFVSVMLLGIWFIFTSSSLYLFTSSFYSVLLIYGSPLLFVFVYRFILFSFQYISVSIKFYSNVSDKIIPKDGYRKQLEAVLTEFSSNNYNWIHIIGIIIPLFGVIVGLVGYLILEIVYNVHGKKNGHRAPSFLGTIGISYLVIGAAIQLLIFFIKIICDCKQQHEEISKELRDDEGYIFIISYLKCLPFFSILLIVYSLIFESDSKDNSKSNTKPSNCQCVAVAVITVICVILFLTFCGFYIGTVISTWQEGKWLLLYLIIFLFSILSNGVTIIKELRNRKFKEASDKADSHFGFDFNSSIILAIILIVIVVIIACIVVVMVYIMPNIKNKFKGDNTQEGIKNDESYLDLTQQLNGFLWDISYDYSFDNYDYYQESSKIERSTRSQSQLCSNDSYGITPAEYGCLSSLAYNEKSKKQYQKDFSEQRSNSDVSGSNENDSSEYEKIDQYLKNKGWEIQQHSKGELHYLVGIKTFTKGQPNKVKVISFRGTYSNWDRVYDVQLFSESAFPILSVTVFPLFTKQTLSKISYGLSFFGTKAFKKTDKTLLGIAKEVVAKEMKEGIPIVLTGHSLGGGIANLVGTDQGLPSFGISPPGTFLGSKGLGLKKKDVPVLVRAIIPDRDPVAAIGINGGIRIRIPCYANSLKCHGIHNSVCMIGELCNDKNMLELCKDTWLSWGFDGTNI
ncbi:hypothetical protein EDI_081770 [Entamoeba dispar SAW760]|uniref:Fungal lipase-type domain-containing protein n=1 Tax=Entamoeba dispar (strain ATCC PRA-260 / SAW760) TaxID=370354 RepID=B0EFV0_ENTDS|nr:uncharacterized protein EDI_081770 [Entamoeba dispar SAW760]EDR26596.1 hypothetical protein EDI_081770 [Entamoeba dispar SAW760]|eukprot:EDR26596.1 hypothetical protein EDI_081770 [Entamoeba dispar SAW760]